MSNQTILRPEETRSQKKVKVRLNPRVFSQNADPNRKKMSVDMSTTFNDVHEMNKKALELLSRRA